MKIIGGEELSEDQWPSVRRLKIMKREASGAFVSHSHCTMTFIKPDLALTAAHCACSGDRYVYSDADRWDDFIATRVLRHPLYNCDAYEPNSYDIALIWFDKKVAMPTSEIIPRDSDESLTRLLLVGYGNDILQITGSFWAGTRKPVSTKSRPSKRSGDREFMGKHSGEVTWRGEAPSDTGFIRISAIFNAKQPVNEPMEEVASAEGDSGGPAFSMESKKIIAIMSRGYFRFTGIGSEQVEAISEMIDLRRTAIQDFLRANGATN